VILALRCAVAGGCAFDQGTRALTHTPRSRRSFLPHLSQALTTFHYLLCCAITGAAGLQGAAQLAAPLVDLPVEEHKRVVDQLIYRQAALTFSSGFLTGLGGIFTMPLAVPTALAAAYIVRFRLCLVRAVLRSLSLSRAHFTHAAHASDSTASVNGREREGVCACGWVGGCVSMP
jgi:hypothetical protein